MGPAFVAFTWIAVVGFAFVPIFIAAFVMLRSFGRAFLLAATFTAGAFVGFLGCGVLGGWILDSHLMDTQSTAILISFATLGAIGGGILALSVLGRFSKYPPWRRY